MTPIYCSECRRHIYSTLVHHHGPDGRPETWQAREARLQREAVSAALLDAARWCRERRGECDLDPDLCVQCAVWDGAAGELERRAKP